MKSIQIYFSLLIVVGILSCQPQELPPIVNDTPVFFVAGDMVDLTAGEDDFYLFTTYEKDTSDVYNFNGRFAKTSDCDTDCNEELIIKIRDVQQTAIGETIDIDNSLSIGNFSYQLANPSVSNDIVVVDLVAEPEGAGPFVYLWAITVDTTATFVSPQVSLTFENTTNLPSINVCLTIINNSMNCQAQTYCNDVFLNSNTPDCLADFAVNFNPAQSLLSLETEMMNGIPPFTYTWSNGATTQNISEIINGPFSATYCVTVTDATGCVDELCKDIAINQGAMNPIVCSSRYSYVKTIEPGNGDILQLSTVFIQYTDTNGTTYRSDLQAQSSFSRFEIISIEDYENNENGEKTKKLKVSVECELFSSNGTPINFPFEGIIAVAYP